MKAAFTELDQMEQMMRLLGAWDGFARHEPGRFVVRIALPFEAGRGAEPLPESMLGIVPDTVENAGRLHEMGIRLRL